MESLERRMELLTTEQRSEVEDFVDFLLAKDNIRQSRASTSSASPVLLNTPPILSSAPPPSEQPPPVHRQDPVVQDESCLPVICADTPPPQVRETVAGGDDWITRDYMDYGKFDRQPSPAEEAVKKVKRKMLQRGEDGKPRQILDWID